VLLPSFKQPGADGTAIHINRPLKPFADHAWSAVVNVTVERDGLVRRYPFGETFDGQYLPAMGAVLAEQYAEKQAPFLVDFSIRAPRFRNCPMSTSCAATRRRWVRLRDKKVIIGGTALELGDRFSIPNGGVVSGRCCRPWPPSRSCRTEPCISPPMAVTLAGLCIIALIMMLSWRRVAARPAGYHPRRHGRRR